jgi:hypothetical protein
MTLIKHGRQLRRILRGQSCASGNSAANLLTRKLSKGLTAPWHVCTPECAWLEKLASLCMPRAVRRPICPGEVEQIPLENRSPFTEGDFFETFAARQGLPCCSRLTMLVPGLSAKACGSSSVPGSRSALILILCGSTPNALATPWSALLGSS